MLIYNYKYWFTLRVRFAVFKLFKKMPLYNQQSEGIDKHPDTIESKVRGSIYY